MEIQRRTFFTAGLTGMAWRATQGVAAAFHDTQGSYRHFKRIAGRVEQDLAEHRPWAVIEP